MTTVRVLVDAVGPWNKGDIVKDAPPGLVEMAEKGTVNLATGERVAEMIEQNTAPKSGSAPEDFKDLKAKAKELKIDGYGKMSVDELKVAIDAAEKEIADAAELKDLQSKATELEIADADKLSCDELIAAVAAAQAAKAGGNGEQ